MLSALPVRGTATNEGMSYSIKKTRRWLRLYYLAIPFACTVVWLLPPFRGLITDLSRWYLLPLWVLGGHLACAISCLITTRSPRYAGLFLRSSLYVYWQEASLVHLQAALLVSLAEEMVFRYAMLGWLTQTMGPAGGLLMVSGLFAALHLRPDTGNKSLASLVDYSLLGLLLGGLTMWLGSLVPAVVIHAMRNYILRCLLITKEEYAERNAEQMAAKKGEGVEEKGPGKGKGRGRGRG